MNSATGNLELTATGSVSVTGLSFQPKLLIFMISDNAAPGFSGDVSFVLSATDGTNHGVHGIRSEDGAAAANADNYSRTSEPLFLQNVSGTTILYGTLTSLNSDGFTLNVTTLSNNIDVYWMAIGGSDISVKVGNFATNTGTGSQSITGVGFEPEALIVWGGSVYSGTTHVDASLSIGVTDGTTTRAIGTFSDDGAGDANTTRIARGDSTLIQVHITNSGSAPGYQANLTSLDSDGFTINCVNNNNGQAAIMKYIALRGVNVSVHEVPTATSAVTISKTGLSFQPSCGFFFSAAADGNSVIKLDNIGSVALIDEAESAYNMAWIDDDNVATMNNTMYLSDAAIGRMYMNPLIGSMNGYADTFAWETDGWSAEMTNPDPTPYDIFALVLGTKATPGGPKQPVTWIS